MKIVFPLAVHSTPVILERTQKRYPEVVRMQGSQSHLVARIHGRSLE